MPSILQQTLTQIEEGYFLGTMTHMAYREARFRAYRKAIEERRTIVTQRKLNALAMKELIHQNHMGMALIDRERSYQRLRSALPLSVGMTIILQKNIPAKVLEQTTQWVVLRIAGQKHRIPRHWIMGRFTYGRGY